MYRLIFLALLVFLFMILYRKRKANQINTQLVLMLGALSKYQITKITVLREYWTRSNDDKSRKPKVKPIFSIMEQIVLSELPENSFKAMQNLMIIESFAPNN